ncbi:MAG: HAMP domain-containing histidine kinase, partial [Acidiferrobacterales bacterium]|nr:HAMP domain-containing histidine kinase [Acidiferrobacterales bacterium]
MTIPLFVVFAFYFHSINPRIRSIWLPIVIAGSFVQHGFFRYYLKPNSYSLRDLLKWNRLAMLCNFSMSCVGVALIAYLTTQLDLRSYYLFNYVICVSIIVVSASGFKHHTLCFAVPICIAMLIGSYDYHDENAFVSVLIPVMLVFLYGVSTYFEKTLKESIKIRFENQSLIDELEKKKDEALEASHAKSVFLASASHDLRQPLHALSLYMEAMREELTTSKQLELGEKIETSVEAFNELFESLLDISKLDSGTTVVRIKDFALEELLTRLRANYQSDMTTKGLILTIDESPLFVRSDPILLERVLNNILNNALKFTHQGQVSLTAKEIGSLVRIEIKDTGTGIPEHELNNVYKEFYQLENPERDRTKGLGLGLAIVKRLAQILELKINIKSEEGAGTQISVDTERGDASKTGTHRKLNIRP